MKTLTNIIGILLIVGGIGALAYRGYEYTTSEKVAKLGNLEVTQEVTKEVDFPPYLGGIALAAGIILVVVSRKK